MYVRTEEHYECALTVKLLQPGGINIMLNRQPLNTFLGRLVPRPTQFSFYTAIIVIIITQAMQCNFV